MKKRIIEWLLYAVIAAGLFGCDGSADGGTGGGFENQDLTAYEDEASALLEHTFSGMIDDGGAAVQCRFDGDQFELTVLVAPPASWSCEDTEHAPAECTDAAFGVIPLEGTLEIDDTYQLTGTAVLFNDLCDVSAYLDSDLPCYIDIIGDGMWDSLSFDSVITKIDWNIQEDEEHPEEGERCWLNVDSIE